MDAHSLQPPTASYQVLLEVAEAIAVHRDLGDLFHDLAGRLHRVVQFDYLNLILHDAKRNVMRLHTLEANRPTKFSPAWKRRWNGRRLDTFWKLRNHLWFPT